MAKKIKRKNTMLYYINIRSSWKNEAGNGTATDLTDGMVEPMSASNADAKDKVTERRKRVAEGLWRYREGRGTGSKAGS
jgi:P pilus assembly chaperone PapD